MAGPARSARRLSEMPARPDGARRSAATPPGSSELAAADRLDLFVGREPAGLLFREGEPAIDGDLEHPANPGHQLYLCAVFLFQLGLRTEGTRFIVSRLAPFDPNFHGRDLSSWLPCRAI